MRARLAAVAVAAFFGAVSPGAAGVNLIKNGSFEDPVINTWYQNYGSSFPGWSVVFNNVDIVSGPNAPPPVAAYQGNQFLDLVGYGDTGAISQGFATQKGKTYSLTFAYGNNPWSTKTAAASFNVFGSGDLLSGIVVHSGSTSSNINWVVYSGTFVADSNATILEFNNTKGGNSGGVLLDAVSVSAVPELSTWMMMLVGFAGIGCVAYRRAKKLSSASKPT